MEKNDREVKSLEIVETIHLDDTEEEKVTPEPSSGDEETGDEVVDDEGTESKPEPESETPAEPATAPEPKPVYGETPRERGMRLEIERLRRDAKESKKKALLGDDVPQSVREPKKSEKYEGVLSKYNPDELQNFEEIFDALADKHGYVKKDELSTTTYQQTADGILDEFLGKHTEYLPENDKDNRFWNQFKEEFQLYKKPENPRDLKKIFDRIHRDIMPERKLDTSVAAAQQKKVQTASHGGTTGSRTPSPRQGSTLDPSLKSHLKGFSDEELQELFGN